MSGKAPTKHSAQRRAQAFPFGFFSFAVSQKLLTSNAAQALVRGLLTCETESDIAAWCVQKNCPPELFPLVLDALDLIHNRWEALAKREVFSPLPDALALERDFFLFVARARLEQAPLESEWLGRIAPFLARHERTDLFLAYAAEHASQLMGRGLYREALRCLNETQRGTRSKHESGLYWQLRVSIVAGISHQARGEFESAHHWQERQDRVLQAFPSRPLRVAWLRRRLSLLVEREWNEKAEDAYEATRGVLRDTDSAILRVLFYQEGIRLFLATHRQEKARDAFHSQADIFAKENIPKTFLSATEERCELALLDNKPEEAAKLIVEEIWWASRKAQFNAMCIAHFSLSRALAAGGAHDTALSTAEFALSLAEKYEFGRDRVRILAFCAAQASKLGNGNAASRYLESAEALSRKIGLPVHTLLLTIALAGHHGTWGWGEWQGLAPERESFIQASKLASAYGFSCFDTVCATQGSGLVSTFEGLLAELVSGRVAFFPKDHTILAYSAGAGILVVSLDRNKARDLIASKLLKAARSGASLQDLHAARWPRVSWQSERHARAVHGWLTEVRSLLSPLGLRVVSKSGRYVVDGPWRMFTRALAAQGRVVSSPQREQKILAFLRQEGPSSGASIARFLGVTRQTLAPLLVTLRTQKRLAFESKGRHSRYWVSEHTGV